MRETKLDYMATTYTFDAPALLENYEMNIWKFIKLHTGTDRVLLHVLHRMDKERGMKEVTGMKLGKAITSFVGTKENPISLVQAGEMLEKFVKENQPHIAIKKDK